MKINLGCGNLKLEGYINIDISERCQPDICMDIRKGLIGIKDGETDEINAGCILEQMSPSEFLFVVNECYRVLREGGTLRGYVPSTDARVLHLDPMDRMFFQEDSFKYLCKSEHHWKNFGYNYGFEGWSNYEAKTNESGIIFFTLIK